MYVLISVILLGTGLYFRGDYLPWCSIAAGLFAIASAIDNLKIIIDTRDEEDGE